MMFLAETLPDIIVEGTDYSEQFAEITGYLQYLTGFAIFAVIVCLCYFVYKFFRIFF